MTQYFRISSWMAYLSAALLVVWGVTVLLRNLFGLPLPGGEFGVLVLIIASFLLYELALVNLSLVARRLARPALARVFTGLAAAPPLLIALVFLLNVWVSGRAAAGYYAPLFVLYFAYAVALAGAGLHVYRRLEDLSYARIGAPLSVAGAVYALHALVGLLALAAGGGVLPQIGFWLMLLGGAAIAFAQYRLGHALGRGAAPNTAAAD